MSKRNNFLDVEDEEEEDLSSEADDHYDSKSSRFHPKRRKLSSSENEGLSADDSSREETENQAEYVAETNDRQDDEDATLGSTRSGSSPKSQRKILVKAKLEKAQRKVRKTGVIYISRVPPFMKPTTLRQLLTPYGNVLRIFLTPEPAPRYQARVRAGGNKKKSFVDGWVEFESKKKARICAETLNGNIIGGKKGGFYHDDIWNIKYLKGFKWNDLMEQVQGEEREREGRMQAEIEKERRERKIFLQNVERAKMERGMEAKRKKKAVNKINEIGADRGEGVESMDEVAESPSRRRRKMSFKQNAVRSDDIDDQTKQPSVPRTLGKIF